jgi:hypothetical protein
MTSKSVVANRQFKDIYAGIGCRSSPTTPLRIKYVGKIGRFCKSCSDDLIRLGLAEPLHGSKRSNKTTTRRKKERRYIHVGACATSGAGNFGEAKA